MPIQWSQACPHNGHLTLWWKAVTMKMRGPSKLIQRLNHENLNWILCGQWAVKCSLRTYAAKLSAECSFITILSCGPFYMISSNKLRIDRFWSVMVFRFVVNLPFWDGLHIKSSNPWNIMHCSPCRIPCRVFIHSNFLSPLVRVYLTGGRAVKGHGEGKGASLFLAQGMWKDRAFPVGRPITLWICAPITSLWQSPLLPLHIHGVLRRHMDRGSWIASEEYADSGTQQWREE